MRTGRLPPLACALLMAVACALGGCQTALKLPPDAAIDKLLRPVTTSPDSVAMEIFEVRIPLDEDAQSESIWQHVDEQCLDPDLRRRMLANGLRAGLIVGGLPDELAQLLGLESEAQTEQDEQVVTADTATPLRTRRVVQINRLRPHSLEATEVRPEAEVLLSDGESLYGKPFQQVTGLYELRAEAVRGQRVAIRLSPELHHGEFRHRYSGSDQGAILYMPSRERETFPDLMMSAEMAPGEMFIVGCLPQAEASLGGLLHTVAAKGRKERKLILLRVLQSPASEILADK